MSEGDYVAADNGNDTASNLPDRTAAAIEEVSAVPETLHMAARAGTIDSVNMLLRNKANPNELDNDGKSALEYAKVAGKTDIAAALRDAGAIEKDPPVSNGPVVDDSTAADESQPQGDLVAYSRPMPAVQTNAPISTTIEPSPAMSPSPTFSNPAPRKPEYSSASNAKAKPEYKEMQETTSFLGTTTDGVLKRTTFMSSLSNYPSSPSISIGGSKSSSSAVSRRDRGPAPGSYDLPHTEKSKFRNTSCYSFGGGPRFQVVKQDNNVKLPGPGAYNPADPNLNVETKFTFGTSVREKRAPPSHQAPGPGAYEQRIKLGGGLMYTAAGRHPTNFMRSRSMPGPGAYSPTLTGAYQTAAKCGFGTSTRGDFTTASNRAPGPGAYEMQNVHSLGGKNSSKYSATSRRSIPDLNSYMTPGPGTYNAHMTSFGAPGAASNRLADEAYRSRNTSAVRDH